MIIHNDIEQGSDEWFALRAGIPTSSNAKMLVTSVGKPSKSLDGYAVTLAGEKYAGKALDAWQGNSWSEHGNDTEQEAIDYYEMVKGVSVERVGFVTLDDGSAGSSPDGMVNDEGLVEVKCLKAETHIEMMLYFQNHDKIKTDYVAQVQDQMLVCERQWCDSIFYHTDLPPFIVRNEPIAAIQAGLISQKILVCNNRDEIYNAIIRQEA